MLCAAALRDENEGEAVFEDRLDAVADKPTEDPAATPVAAALALARLLCAAALCDENEGEALFEDGPDAAAVADEADADAAADASESDADEATADEAENGLGVPEAERESAVCDATVLDDSRTK